MSVRQCIEDIVAFRASHELPTMYDDIKTWLKHSNGEDRPFTSRDLDDVEPDLVSWETMMITFIEDTMGAGLPVDIRWETVRPFRVTYALQFLNTTLWLRFFSKKPEKRDGGSTHVNRGLADLLLQAGNAQKMDELFRQYSTQILELMKAGAVSSSTEMTHETLELRESTQHRVSVLESVLSVTHLGLEIGLLRRTICVADFYYMYHALRSVWKSPEDMSTLMEQDPQRLQKMMDFLDVEPEEFKVLKIYPRFIRIRDHLNFALARRRGIVPSSFFVTGIQQQGDRPTGRGGFADVWQGVMWARDAEQHQQRVALKVLRTFEVSEERRESLNQALYREAIVWKMTNHQNVLKFVGLGSLPDGTIAMVSPWMGYGNLLSYVQKKSDANRVELLSQAANGLRYLHKVNIIHGDLKCANIMVDGDGIAQLADFGLAAFEIVHASVAGSLSRSAGGTPRWQAPELLMPSLFNGSGRISRESDIYAFGMTGLELFTEKAPFSHLPEPAFLVEVVGNGIEPEWPGEVAEKRGLSKPIWELLRSCWKREPSSRKSSDGVRADAIELASGYIAEVRFPERWGPDTIGRIRRIDKADEKRGWFDNVWNVEMRIPLDGVKVEDKEEDSLVEMGLSVRVINTHGGEEARRARLRDIVRSLRKLRHRNLAQVQGLCQGITPIRTAILMDVGPNVDLLMTYLREKRIGNRLQIAKDIASGLEYLHRKGFVHGDLRTANIVVDDGVAKLVDYGLPSCFRENNDAFVRRLFKAPELLEIPKDQEEMPTSESDIFALGTTLYEVFAERLPLDAITTSKSAFSAGAESKDFRPSHPGNVAERRGLSSALWMLMKECWSTSASERPLSRTVVRCLEERRVGTLNSSSCFLG